MRFYRSLRVGLVGLAALALVPHAAYAERTDLASPAQQWVKWQTENTPY